MSISDVLSADRFSAYLAWAGDDDQLAQRLYAYNIKLSAALYGPLHMVEVALRNGCDRALSARYGPLWIDDKAVLPTFYQRGAVTGARQKLVKVKKAETHGRIVAELDLGFWTSLFDRSSNHLWPVLRPIFRARGIQAKAIRTTLCELRHLRNRIARYEPILASPLAVRYDDASILAGWLSSDAAAWIARHSTWPAVYPNVPILMPLPAGGLRVSPSALPYMPTF